MLASVKRAPAAADAIPASRTERIRNFFGHRAPVTPAPVLAEDKTVISPSGGGKRRGPSIADHELIRSIGSGGYGEVWLAKDVIGTFHAVKIIYKRSFADDAPYLREFNGIKKFTPLSRSHPSLMNILHVGIDENDGYFFCIMELGDDEVNGQAIDPGTYSPKSLASEMDKEGGLNVKRTVELAIPLCSALAFLHDKRLIHRDVKPSNVIFGMTISEFYPHRLQQSIMRSNAATITSLPAPSAVPRRFGSAWRDRVHRP